MVNLAYSFLSKQNGLFFSLPYDKATIIKAGSILSCFPRTYLLASFGIFARISPSNLKRGAPNQLAMIVFQDGGRRCEYEPNELAMFTMNDWRNLSKSNPNADLKY